MPEMSHMDNFERCLWSTTEFNMHCFLHTIIKPDNSSETWNSIEKFSDDTKRHFSHDLIYAGLCLSKCKQKLEALSSNDQESLYVEEFEWRWKRRVMNTFQFIQS